MIAHGKNCLGGSIIISENNISSTQYDNLDVEINATMDEDYDFYCNQTDRCNIMCQSSNACTNMHLYCFGECWVDCGDDIGIDCPRLQNVTGTVYFPTLS